MMANIQITIIISLSLLPLAFSATVKPVEKNAEVAVEGMVYCQRCERKGTWSFKDAEPIPAAFVSVICKDHRNRVSYYLPCMTNESGYFYAQLKGFKLGHYLLDHPLHSCRVKLLSSPLTTCNLLTNINTGISGSPLRYENKRLFGKNYESVVYATGPLAFRPAHCPPSAHH